MIFVVISKNCRPNRSKLVEAAVFAADPLKEADTIKKTITFLKTLAAAAALVFCALNILGGVAMMVNVSDSGTVRENIRSNGCLMLAGAILYIIAVIVCIFSKNILLNILGSVLPAAVATVFTAVAVRSISLISRLSDTLVARHLPAVFIMVLVGLITVLYYFSDEQKAKRQARIDRDNAPSPKIVD